jgi:quinol monooxygenase YgiN
MYGLIGSLITHPGKREELIALISQSSGDMPGCLSYVIARDTASSDKLWVTEVWDSAASHEASLKLPLVAETISKAMPLIAGFGERFVTEPVGGTGL